MSYMYVWGGNLPITTPTFNFFAVSAQMRNLIPRLRDKKL